MTLVRIDNKFHKPTPFPKGCRAYLQFFKIEENNYPYWLYQNAEGEDLFIVYRQDYEKDGQRKACGEGVLHSTCLEAFVRRPAR